MSEKERNFPRLPLRFLRWFCPSYLYEELEGDLLQRFNMDLQLVGERQARRKLAWSVILFFRPGIVLRKMNPSSGLVAHFGSVFRMESNFQRINDLAGWLVFGAALVVYALTMEETASYWDPGEFIAASYRLQVPHPPGAPLFLMIGRIFSFLAMGNEAYVAYAINLVSVVASALTIMFLFWSIVLIGRKACIEPNDQKILNENAWVLIVAGLVGSLAYAFSDSFWFSAVEAEVYGFSSLFTAMVVWATLKWELIKDEGRANRWLILIAYMVGLSIGVHLLNLLTLPALALIYYFRNFNTSRWGVMAALAVGFCLIVLVNDLIIPGLPSMAGNFEIFFVNSLGFPFGSGALFFATLLGSVLVWGICYTHSKHHARANTVLLGLSFLLVGYCSYAMIIIRSNQHPPLNESAPDDVMSFVSYLKREQYGSTPLFYGPYYTARPIGYKVGSTRYVKDKDRYVVSGNDFDLQYKPGEETILPRAWSPEHKNTYQRLLRLREGQRPTFYQNLYYMFSHQLGVMYMRYFMWNFAGRSGDDEGADWLQPQDWFREVPASLSSPARNNYYMIPFFLGLVGMFWHLVKDSRGFAVTSLLFFMLGAAIVVFLNSPPDEPRERDYIYAGSFYAFAIWIGLAVIAIANAVNRYIGSRGAAAILSLLICASAPGIMAYEGWDDHDRSNRFFSVDAAINALKSCDRDGVIFTGGDNDTFPLWYAQDAEGCRTDVRVLVLSYCNTDWYIDQTTRKAHESKPFTYTIPIEEYRRGGPNEILSYVDAGIDQIDVEEYLGLLARKFPALRSGGENVVPGKVLTLKVDKAAVLGQGIVPVGMEHLIVDSMAFPLLDDHLEKSDLLFLDLVATSKWSRPVYLNPTSLAQLNIDVRPYVVQMGNAYRLLPVRNPRSDRDYLVDTGKSFDLMLHQFKFRGLDDPEVYHTNDYKMQVLQHRSNLNSLAEALIDEGKVENAKTVLSFSLEKMPGVAVAYDPSLPDTVNLLFKVGQKEKARDVATAAWNEAFQTAAFLADEERISFELRKSLFMLDSLQRTLYVNGELEHARTMDADYQRLMARLEAAFESGRIVE